MGNQILPFYIQVDPCPETELIALTLTDDYTYVVGDSPVSSSSYSFEQPQECGYELQYSLENAPSFVSIDPDTQKLIIETDVLDDAGVYTVDFVATLPLPTSWEKTEFTPITAKTTVTLDIRRLPVGCEISNFDTFLLENMQGSVHGFPVQQ